MLIPFSPISVMSPAGRISKSLIISQAIIVLTYFALSRGLPNKILSRIVLFWIHDCYSTYANLPSSFTTELTLRSLDNSRLLRVSNSKSVASLLRPPKLLISCEGRYIISPIIAFNRLLLPAPQSPIITTNSPFFIVMSSSFRIT